jgi:predicted glycoside hydrolase/deacetylase ChbG (UPF0249 family)
MTNVTVCADDFGLISGIAAGILACLEPCGSVYELHDCACLWLDRAPELRPFAEIADIGLHFTLTDLNPVRARRSWPLTGAFRRSLRAEPVTSAAR